MIFMKTWTFIWISVARLFQIREIMDWSLVNWFTGQNIKLIKITLYTSSYKYYHYSETNIDMHWNKRPLAISRATVSFYKTHWQVIMRTSPM